MAAAHPEPPPSVEPLATPRDDDAPAPLARLLCAVAGAGPLALAAALIADDPDVWPSTIFLVLLASPMLTLATRRPTTRARFRGSVTITAVVLLCLGVMTVFFGGFLLAPVVALLLLAAVTPPAGHARTAQVLIAFVAALIVSATLRAIG